MSQDRIDGEEPPRFRQKVIKSTKLSSLKFGSEVLLRLLSTIILTRLLSPDVYGVFAVVLLYMYLLEMFSDLGLRSLVLTKEDPVDDAFLSTCWTVSILRGAVILLFSGCLALIILSLQGQNFFAPDNAYAAAELPFAIIGLGFGTLIKGAQTPMVFMAEKHMRFERVTFMQISANLISLIVTIILAFYLRSVWALVFGVWARSLFEVVVGFLLFRNPNIRLSLNRSDLWLVYDRGRWIIGTSILTALSTSADRLFLGVVMTSTAFGYYTIAIQILTIFDRFLGSINTQMGLQVFRKLLDDPPSVFQRNYYRYRLIFDAIAGVCTGGLLVSAPMLVDIIFDDRYANVADILQILSLTLLLVGPLILRDTFIAERKFKQMTQLSLLTAVSMWASLTFAILVLQSIPVALVCIALYRLPEAVVLLTMARRRGWVVFYRELTIVPFLLLGATLGWVVMTAYYSLF